MENTESEDAKKNKPTTATSATPLTIDIGTIKIDLPSAPPRRGRPNPPPLTPHPRGGEDL